MILRDLDVRNRRALALWKARRDSHFIARDPLSAKERRIAEWTLAFKRSLIAPFLSAGRPARDRFG